jgi:DNA-binding NtrC family response regulator
LGSNQPIPVDCGKAADLLQIPRKTLYDKLQKLGMAVTATGAKRPQA